MTLSLTLTINNSIFCYSPSPGGGWPVLCRLPGYPVSPHSVQNFKGPVLPTDHCQKGQEMSHEMLVAATFECVLYEFEPLKCILRFWHHDLSFLNQYLWFFQLSLKRIRSLSKLIWQLRNPVDNFIYFESLGSPFVKRVLMSPCQVY